MKSIFITSFHPLISRNILQTDILRLVSGCYKIYILCPDYKYDFFDKNFSSINVEIIPVKITSLSKLESLWKELGNSLLDTTTIRSNRKERYRRDGRFFGYFMFLMINLFFSKLSFFKKIYQYFSLSIFYNDFYEHLFKKYEPNLLFSTDIFNDEDVRCLATAKRMGILNIGMVRSWDNATNKGVLPVMSDSFMVHNEVIEEELRSIHLVSNKHEISVTGIPQFDYYLNYKPSDPEYFYRQTGFSSERKIILFAPTGLKFVDDDWFILQKIHDAVLSGDILDNPQIIVRFPPGDKMNLDKVFLSSDVSIFIDYPGVDFHTGLIKDRELDKRDMSKLADTLYYSDVLISVGSTLCIDIAAFDKPIICPNIAVDDIQEDRSMTKMYKKHHYDYLLRTNACEIPNSVPDLIKSINTSINNANINELGRMRLIKEQMFLLDGSASVRIAEIFKRYLK